jgi:hypothetical protein
MSRRIGGKTLLLLKTLVLRFFQIVHVMSIVREDMALEHLHRRPQNGGRQGADMSVLGAPAGPSKILGPGSHTGSPKTPALKNVQYKYNSNINTYKFMKCKYNIVYTNK